MFTLSGTGSGALYGAGVEASGTVISSGGVEIVYSGAEDDDATVLSGGTLIFSGGGKIVDNGTVVTDIVLESAGLANLVVLGEADGVTVGNDCSLTVLGLADGITVNGGSLSASDGSTTKDIVVNSGSLVNSHGIIDTISLNSGSLFLSSAGVANDVTVNSGGFVSARAYAAVDGATVHAGGQIKLVAVGSATSAVIDGGFLSLSAGSIALDTTVSDGGVLQLGYFGSAISTIIDDGGTLSIVSASFASGVTVNSGGNVVLASGTGVPEGLVIEAGGSIELQTLAYHAGGTASLNATTDVLTLSVSGVTSTVQLAGNYAGDYFHVMSGSSLVSGFRADTLVTASTTPCYCRGTLILTGRGEVAVEDLRIDDTVVTLSGALKPVRWIGRRSYDGRFAAGNREVLPVLIRAGALADGVPRRDLFVSPRHAMYLDAGLVEAAALVNGVSIVQAESVERVEYFHIELDAHDVVFAEGAPAETFVDDDSRLMFHNAGEYASLYPDDVSGPARFCAPRIEDGPALAALHRRIALRCGAAAADAGPLQGHLELIDRHFIRGWAWAPGDTSVELRITDNGVTIGQITADEYRDDLVAAGIGDGRHGFSFVVPGGLSPLVPHVIEVQRASDGQVLEPLPSVVSAMAVPPYAA